MIADVWEEAQETLAACRPFITFPPTEKAVAHGKRCREPSNKYWYEAQVESFTDAEVVFGINLWGFKYQLRQLRSSKDTFYLLTDHLDARIRFVTCWLSLDESKRELLPALDSTSLAPVRGDVPHELSNLRHSYG